MGGNPRFRLAIVDRCGKVLMENDFRSTGRTAWGQMIYNSFIRGEQSARSRMEAKA